MSGYSKFDPILSAWSQRHGLRISTMYRDDEVRSTDVVSRRGEKFQIWLGVPTENDEVSVHVWDYKERRRAWANVPMHKLDATLEAAFETATSWMQTLK